MYLPIWLWVPKAECSHRNENMNNKQQTIQLRKILFRSFYSKKGVWMDTKESVTWMQVTRGKLLLKKVERTEEDWKTVSNSNSPLRKAMCCILAQFFFRHHLKVFLVSKILVPKKLALVDISFVFMETFTLKNNAGLILICRNTFVSLRTISIVPIQ